MSRRNVRGQHGFTIVELMAAIAILGIGLLALAALMSQMSVDTSDSRYMSTEALLGSEKLEDLNRYPSSDPAVAASGSNAGDLSSDKSASVTVGAVTQNVDYFDTVQISAGNGQMVETITGTDATGSATYTTTTHKPDGSVTAVTTVGAPPAPTADTLAFKRRWVIEPDTPVTGVRRITVLVSLQSVPRATTFQTSMVRP
jgi:prepilin-type N-terminal cleavage/methylation domain-containing protein